MNITNTNPVGSVDVPLLGRVVDAGETIDVDPEIARQLLTQPANWARQDDRTVAQLKADLDAAGITYPAKARKADLLLLLDEAPTTTTEGSDR